MAGIYSSIVIAYISYSSYVISRFRSFSAIMGKSKRTSQCPGCHTAKELHDFGDPGRDCTGPKSPPPQDSPDGWSASPPKENTSPARSSSTMDSLLAAIGNLAIQVDKIASNQARLNVEVDALKNNNHDDKGSPSSSYQAIPVASASSSASQTKLEQAILRGEFVNFIDLLKSQREHVTQEANAVTLDDRGNLILQKARPHQTIDSFSTWLSAWFEFEKIIVSAHPERYAELAEYRVVIHKANRKFAWPAVNAYDIRFRQETARSGGRRFDQIDHTLYITTLDATA